MIISNEPNVRPRGIKVELLLLIFDNISVMKKLMNAKHHGTRPHDYIYDPNCFFSHAKDHQRAAIESFNRVAEYQICPNFSRMFSDLKNYPPAKIKIKYPDRVPPCVDRTWHDKSSKNSASQQVDIEGTHHCLFYRRPNLPNTTPEPCIVERKDISKSCSAADENEEPQSVDSTPFTRTCGTQTIYRESEAQTVPYTPKVSVWDSQEIIPLEIFHLLHLKWGKGLPVGLKELEDIEWEKNHRSLKVLLDNPSQLTQAQHMTLLEYVHKEKWLHREKEIQEIHNLRMQLAEKLMVQRGGELSDRLENIISRKYERKLQEKNQKLKKIRNDHKRALRKLVNKHKGISMKYKRLDPITEQSDYTSELYGPLLRHGVDPRNRHEMPLGIRSKFLHDFKGLQVLEKTDRWLSAPRVVSLKEKSDKNSICTRAFGWSDVQLLKLQKHFEESASKRNERIFKKMPTCLKRIPRPYVKPPTPTLEEIPESKDKLYQAVTFMQKIIIGRAIQILMVKGKEKYQGLIDEILPTLSEEKEDTIKEEEIRVKMKYQNWMDEQEIEEIFENMQDEYVGETVINMLDFLSKEMERLDDERSIHALLLLADRERHKREAAEAGRRQIEEQRRREHDEVFRQVIQVHQETVDFYLEDIVLNTLDWVATAESREFVRELARDIDLRTKDMEERNNYWEYKELVSDLVFDFIIPEAHEEFQHQENEKLQERCTRVVKEEVDKILSDEETYDQSQGGESSKEENSPTSESESNEEITEVPDSETYSNPADESSDSSHSLLP